MKKVPYINGCIFHGAKAVTEFLGLPKDDMNYVNNRLFNKAKVIKGYGVDYIEINDILYNDLKKLKKIDISNIMLQFKPLTFDLPFPDKIYSDYRKGILALGTIMNNSNIILPYTGLTFNDENININKDFDIKKTFEEFIRKSYQIAFELDEDESI